MIFLSYDRAIKEWHSLLPQSPWFIMTPSQGEADAADKSADQRIRLASKHAWHMRVARYFAFCADGGSAAFLKWACRKLAHCFGWFPLVINRASSAEHIS